MIVAKATIRWSGDAFAPALRAEMERRLSRAASLVQHNAQESITEPYPPASTPGSPPHMRSGDLFESVFYVVDGGRLVAIIGSKLPKKYGLFLEIGTRKMAARPWLRPALARSIPQIQQIFGERLTGATAGFQDVSKRSIILFQIKRTFGLGG